jgi:hypothetical protein
MQAKHTPIEVLGKQPVNEYAPVARKVNHPDVSLPAGLEARVL